jgi:hypothetical protein
LKNFIFALLLTSPLIVKAQTGNIEKTALAAENTPKTIIYKNSLPKVIYKADMSKKEIKSMSSKFKTGDTIKIYTTDNKLRAEKYLQEAYDNKRLGRSGR